MKNISLTDKEFDFISRPDVIITKKEAMAKLWYVLKDAEEQLKHLYKEMPLPEGPNWRYGKLSQGDNYKQLPYLMLDFPNHLKKDKALAFRSMFWWGHEISFTLHIQGEYKTAITPFILKNKILLEKEGFYLCTGDTPWEYHFEEDNYLPFSSLSAEAVQEELERKKFIKISRKYPLEAYQEIPQLALDTYRLLLQHVINPGHNL